MIHFIVFSETNVYLILRKRLELKDETDLQVCFFICASVLILLVAIHKQELVILTKILNLRFPRCLTHPVFAGLCVRVCDGSHASSKKA